MTQTLNVALIADIIASKKMKERAQTQVILSDIIDSVNTTFKSEIESPLTITLGDEFQGIVKTVDTAFYLIDLITLTLQTRMKQKIGEDIALRWGIGIGEMATPIKSEGYSIGMDGPAFWHAREAIELVQDQNDYGRLNEKIVTQTSDDDFFNSIIRLQNIIRNEWTTSQKETVHSILNAYRYDKWTNQDIRKVLNTHLNQSFSDQTVSKRIISTNIKQYTHSRRLLAEKIEEWREVYDK